LCGVRRQTADKERVVKSVYISVLVCSSFVTLGGCALPTATYVKFSSPQTEEKNGKVADAFALSTTTLDVKMTKGKDDAPPTFDISVVRTSDDKALFGITPNRTWYGVNTTLSIAKVSNTPLVDSISTEVEDKRVDFIKGAAKFVGTVIGVVAGAQADEQIQDAGSYALQPLLAKQEGREPTSFVIAKGMKMEVGAVPNDAREVAKLDVDKLKRVFIYSACRPATLTVTSNLQTRDIRVSVADSRYVQTVAFPLKGKIQSHSECGISVLPEKATVTSEVDLAQAALDELVKLRDAINKKPDTSTDASKPKG
jgi:hypothetical protein